VPSNLIRNSVSDPKNDLGPAATPGPRLLIIRFSSFGDLIQASSVPAAFLRNFPNAEIDWLVRSDFSSLLEAHPHLNKVISFDRKSGFLGLVKLAWRLGSTNYDYLYDAHSNLRSLLVSSFIRLLTFLRFKPVRFTRRPKSRLRRWLFFKFRMQVLPKPYRGAESFLWPLGAWGVEAKMPPGPQFWTNTDLPEDIERELQTLPKPWIALAPSAAWPMKRWPIEHWKTLIASYTDVSFLLLGGPEDTFLADLQRQAPGRTVNFAGRLNLMQSATLLKMADLVIANDTGLLHVADQFERPTIALIGPTAFGYPSHSSSQALEIELKCKPCSKDGRGRCKNALYQRCLVDLKPEAVTAAARLKLKDQASNSPEMKT
jgi:ADP-heptose:LPS heptosyltransferase